MDSEYTYISGYVTPACRYIEGEEKVTYWIDFQNCMVHTVPEEGEEETAKTNGKNWWIIEPMKPKGMVISNQEEWNKYVKWFVTWSSIYEDEDCEWDFETLKPIKNESNIS